MLTKEKTEQRKPIWQAFSDLWLDNELQDFEISRIVALMKESNYDLDELKEIFYREVAPVVYKNTFSMTGEWAGFDAERLFKSIIENIEKQESSFVHKTWVNSFAGKYLMTKMVADDWDRILRLYQNKK